MTRKLHIRYSHFYDVSFVRLKGELTPDTEGEFKQFIDSIGSDNLSKVILDLEGIDRCDRHAVNLFIGFLELINRAGGRILLINASGKVRKILSLSGADGLLPLAVNERDAFRKLQKLSLVA